MADCMPRACAAGKRMHCVAPVCLRWHAAVDDGHVHAGLLPDVAVLHDAGDATATIGASPGILAELGAIDVLDGLADGVLASTDHLLEAGLATVGEGGKEEYVDQKWVRIGMFGVEGVLVVCGMSVVKLSSMRCPLLGYEGNSTGRKSGAPRDIAGQ